MQLTDTANNLADVYRHVATAFHKLEDENSGLKRHSVGIENPSAEVLHLRTENAVLRAELQELRSIVTELAHQRDVSQRQARIIYDRVKNVLDETMVRQRRVHVSCN